MEEYKDSNNVSIDETTPTESLHDVPTLSNPLPSIQKTYIEHHQTALSEHAKAVIDQDGLFVENLTNPQFVEKALPFSLAFHGLSSSDLSHTAIEKSDNKPSQPELQSYTSSGIGKVAKEMETDPNKLQDGCCAVIPDVQTNKTQTIGDSTASADIDTASFPSEKQPNTVDPNTCDALKEMRGTISSQIDNESPAAVADSQTSRSSNIEVISKVEYILPLKVNGHPRQNHVGAQNKEIKISESSVFPEKVKRLSENRGFVDTTAPFESVKEAVTKFGGIVDWKAYKALTIEKRNHCRYELEKVQEEFPIYRKKSEEAEGAKIEVLKELDTTRKLVEELKLNLEKAQTEEAHAKQDAGLAQLREKEMEDGISDDVSVAAKMQLDIAKARREAAAAELKSVKEELLVLKDQYSSSVSENELAIKRAEEAIFASKEMERSLEELTMELISTKESLESAHAAHIEAEEHRMGASLAKDQDCRNWDKEVKQVEEEMFMLNKQLLQAENFEENFKTASNVLADLKKELGVYMESKLKEQLDILDEKESKKKELAVLKINLEKAEEEVSILRVAEAALKSELKMEKAGLSSMRQREGMASIAVSSLEAEIERTKEGIRQAIEKEKEARDRMVELPKLLQQAALEANQFKSLAKMAREAQRKAGEEAEQAKATVSTKEIRLQATLKEMEAAIASERLALAAVNALKESEEAAAMGESPRGVTLPLEEYYILSKRAHDAEEFANERITTAIKQIQIAKESELKSLGRLEEACVEMDKNKEALRAATEMAEKAQEGKLGVEHELRKWRAEHEKQRKANDGCHNAVNSPKTPTRISEESATIPVAVTADVIHPSPGPLVHISGNKIDSVIPDFKPRKKSFFPRIVMFLVRRRSKSRK